MKPATRRSATLKSTKRARVKDAKASIMEATTMKAAKPAAIEAPKTPAMKPAKTAASAVRGVGQVRLCDGREA